MTQQRSALTSEESMSSFLSVGRAGLPSNSFAGQQKPWQQRLPDGHMTAQLHFEQSTGTFLEVEPYGTESFWFDETSSALPSPHNAISMTADVIDGNPNYLHDGFFDTSLQTHYSGMPKILPNNNSNISININNHHNNNNDNNNINNTQDYPQFGQWSHGMMMNAGAERSSATNLNSIPQFGPSPSPMPIAPAFERYRAGIVAQPRSCPNPMEAGDHEAARSPNQSSSSVTGSSLLLSSRNAAAAAAAVSLSALSRRNSNVFLSQPAVSQSIERTQSDDHARPMSIAIPPPPPEAAAPARKGKLVHVQSVNAATKDENRETSTRTTETSKASISASEYSTPSPRQRRSVAPPTDDERRSSSSSFSWPGSLPSLSEPTSSRIPPIPEGFPQAEGPPPAPPQGEPQPQGPPSQGSLPQGLPQGSQRQRNRRAATKCREKTKAAMAQLEATERAISLEHMELSKTVAELRAQVLLLKNELLLHGNCNCDVIQQYLRNAARSIGEGSYHGSGSGSGNGSVTSSQGPVAAWINSPGLGRHKSFS